MLKGYKYRLYPKQSQIEMIHKHFGCSRWIYNHCLDRKIKSWKENGISLSRFELQKEIPILKQQPETAWLSEVNAQSLQSSLEHLDKAYRRFFRLKTGFPKFKSKNDRQSFSIPQYVRVDWDKSLVYLPKTGYVKIVVDRKAEGKIRSATVSMSSSGKYFVSILVDTGTEEPKPSEITKETSVGIDLGLHHFVVLSTGEKIDAPKSLSTQSKVFKQLRKLQQKASKKVKGSNNRRKVNRKVAIKYERISNVRKDFLHKLSTKIIRENQTICLEDLNVQGMMQNHRLAKSISDATWSNFVAMLGYKAKWNGRNILQIGRFDPSSKMCSGCGNINRELKLSDRRWTCSVCGTIHDRDINAAINIRDIALLKNNLKIGEELPDFKPVENGSHTSGRKTGSKSHSSKQETQGSLVLG
jgi:putative transposase